MNAVAVRAVVAPDSFKGTHSSIAVAAAIAEGLETVGVEAVQMPVADGGEGTLGVLVAPLSMTIIPQYAPNAWGWQVSSCFGLNSEGTALVEVAATCGLHTPHEGARDPMTASTYGVGHQIAAAAALGADHVIIAAGGSASTDGGVGAVQALRDAALSRVPRITVLSDVQTPYLEAAEVFAPQKGASPAEVVRLTRRLELVRRTLRRDPQEVPGTGAAGGLSGALWANFDAIIISGADFVLDALDFEKAVAQADLVVTGEGRLDAQTAEGKIVSRVLARSGSTPVHAVVGSLDPAGVDVRPFGSVLVASTPPQMQGAGAAIGRALTAGRVLPVCE